MAQVVNNKGRFSQLGKQADLKLGKCYYEYHQAGEKDTIVMVHGITWWSFCFDDLVHNLVQAGHPVLTLDLWGRGHSDSPDKTYNVSLFIEQIKELIEHVLGKKKIILLGMSMGGGIVGAFSSKYPDMLLKSIILCPAGINTNMPSVVSVLGVPFLGTAIWKIGGREVLHSTLLNQRLQNDFHPSNYKQLDEAGLINDYIEKLEWVILHKDGFLDAFKSTVVHFEWSGLQKDFSKIPSTLPILIISADKDAVIPIENVQLISKLLPHAQQITMKDAGHAFHLEYPKETFEHIKTFLSA